MGRNVRRGRWECIGDGEVGVSMDCGVNLEFGGWECRNEGLDWVWGGKE